MNMKGAKKMKAGFMCHSAASTTVCMPQDFRTVIVPGQRMLVDQTAKLLINNKNYIRLGDDKRRSIQAPFIRRKNQERRPKETASSLAISDQNFQVVEMRVSLHCQGCAGKVKRHLSKMEGVTSYNIDLESNRVTVMGRVSPSGVLESISKVKKAEFWPPPPPSPSS